MDKIKVGVIGGAGYTGGELLRILINHPFVEIGFVHSKSNAGKPVYKAHQDLFGETDLEFSGSFNTNADVIFLCMGHGDSKIFLNENPDMLNSRVIDLSQDFRDESNGFVYGLPELNKEKIKNAKLIANPGCFATAIQLSILPLAQKHLLKNDIHVSAITGSTGAGQKPSETSHFSWRSSNISTYKVFNHQHLKEIKQSIEQLQSGFIQRINFVPYRGNFARGIMASVYSDFSGGLEEAEHLYKEFYKDHPFTHVSDMEVDIKQVVNTNKCFIKLEKHDGIIFINTVIDNLTKGASGQAVQNMNLMFGLGEKTGLDLKPVAF